MTDNVVITLSCGTDNPNRATRALQLAMVAKKQGKNITLFLLDDGVYIAREGITATVKAVTGDSADDHLSFLQEYEVPILVCSPCAAARKITEADLVKGARMATGVDLIELCCNAAVISL